MLSYQLLCGRVLRSDTLKGVGVKQGELTLDLRVLRALCVLIGTQFPRHLGAPFLCEVHIGMPWYFGKCTGPQVRRLSPMSGLSAVF